MQFEYKTVTVDNYAKWDKNNKSFQFYNPSESFNTMGNDGWELVSSFVIHAYKGDKSISLNVQTVQFIFKRTKK